MIFLRLFACIFPKSSLRNVTKCDFHYARSHIRLFIVEPYNPVHSTDGFGRDGSSSTPRSNLDTPACDVPANFENVHLISRIIRSNRAEKRRPRCPFCRVAVARHTLVGRCVVENSKHSPDFGHNSSGRAPKIPHRISNKSAQRVHGVDQRDNGRESEKSFCIKFSGLCH